jgi:hypothetical protein
MTELEGRELDEKMAELMGWEKRIGITEVWVDEMGFVMATVAAWQPSTDIAAAMLVVEKMRERGIYIAIVAQKDDYLITASDFHPHINCYHYLLDLRADSFEKLPEAICRAARMAAEEE